MTERRTHAYAWFLFAGGVCFIARAVAALFAGPPPSTGIETLAWIDGARVVMMLGNEALVIGAGLLIMGLRGFYQVFRHAAPVATTAGCTLLFSACVVCFVLGIVQGRFVYPIHGFLLSRPEDAELLVSLYFGGYHLVALVFAAATASWACAMLSAAQWRLLGYLGFVVAAGSVVSSYPDLIGPLLVFALETALAFWWIGISFKMRAPGES